MVRTSAKKAETGTTLLEAAKKVLRQNGYSGLSTRDVAAAAGVPLSQIHYHFGSKQGLVLALFEYLNAQLLDRQNALFGDATLKLSEQWDRACDYLDDDIASGYVRVLQELIAASWADAEVAKVVRSGLLIWFDLDHGARAQGRARARRPRPVLGQRKSAALHRQRVHRRGEPLSARLREEGRARCARRCGASAISFALRKPAHRRGDVMRAKLPDRNGFVERDGVKIHYEVYGDGPETMVFVPPWSIVHSRVYKAQLPYFSERFRCIAFDGRGNGKSDRPTDVGRLLARQLCRPTPSPSWTPRMRARRSWSASPSAACTPACSRPIIPNA